MKIDVSESTFLRLQQLAEPLVDSVDDVIQRLLEAHGKKGLSKVNTDVATNRPLIARPSPDALRGFQRELWDLVIERIPTAKFYLQDVYARKEPLVQIRPHVQEIEASIRAGLEKLRDKGYIEFIDNRGSYRKLL